MVQLVPQVGCKVVIVTDQATDTTVYTVTEKHVTQIGSKTYLTYRVGGCGDWFDEEDMIVVEVVTIKDVGTDGGPVVVVLS